MCIHSTLRSDGSSSATTASMPRLSANKWNGHTGTVSSFLRALTRFRSEIPAYIQKFIFTGTYADSKGGLIMVQNWHHAQLDIAHADAAEQRYHMGNPYPQSQGLIDEFYYSIYPKIGQVEVEPRNVYESACHTNSNTELAALYPDLHDRYKVAPYLLDTINVQYGNMLLNLIDDEGTREEIQQMYVRGRGTDIMAYLQSRYNNFASIESGHLLKLKLDLDVAMRGTMDSITTDSFHKLHSNIMKAYYDLPDGNRKSDEDMAECFRNIITLQCPDSVVVSFENKIIQRGVALDDFHGTIDVIRFVLASSDIKHSYGRGKVAGRGLSAQQQSTDKSRTDPPKDRKPPRAPLDMTKPPRTPCTHCKDAGKGEQWHWHSQCPKIGRAHV